PDLHAHFVLLHQSTSQPNTNQPVNQSINQSLKRKTEQTTEEKRRAPHRLCRCRARSRPAAPRPRPTPLPGTPPCTTAPARPAAPPRSCLGFRRGFSHTAALLPYMQHTCGHFHATLLFIIPKITKDTLQTVPANF